MTPRARQGFQAGQGERLKRLKGEPNVKKVNVRKAKTVCPALLVGLLLGATTAPMAGAAEHWLGLGAQFWRTVDGLPSGSDFDNLQDDGWSWVLSYQYRPRGLFTFELDAELFPDGFAGTDQAAVAPQAFVFIGHGFYGGVGAGVTISDGLDGNTSDPFFMGRLGYRFALLGSLDVDLHLTYRFDDWEALQGIDVSTDTYTFGAALRLKL